MLSVTPFTYGRKLSCSSFVHRTSPASDIYLILWLTFTPPKKFKSVQGKIAAVKAPSTGLFMMANFCARQWLDFLRRQRSFCVNFLKTLWSNPRISFLIISTSKKGSLSLSSFSTGNCILEWITLTYARKFLNLFRRDSRERMFHLDYGINMTVSLERTGALTVQNFPCKI